MGSVTESRKEQLLMQTPVITLYGKREVIVQNYRYLKAIGDCEIQIRTYQNGICIRGKNLYVSLYTREWMKIRGGIESIQFE